ncbi:hypothetical protein GP486_005101, partial [Trichoglossum hirsutum]
MAASAISKKIIIYSREAIKVVLALGSLILQILITWVLFNLKYPAGKLPQEGPQERADLQRRRPRRAHEHRQVGKKHIDRPSSSSRRLSKPLPVKEEQDDRPSLRPGDTYKRRPTSNPPAPQPAVLKADRRTEPTSIRENVFHGRVFDPKANRHRRLINRMAPIREVGAEHRLVGITPIRLLAQTFTPTFRVPDCPISSDESDDKTQLLVPPVLPLQSSSFPVLGPSSSALEEEDDWNQLLPPPELSLSPIRAFPSPPTPGGPTDAAVRSPPTSSFEFSGPHLPASLSQAQERGEADDMSVSEASKLCLDEADQSIGGADMSTLSATMEDQVATDALTAAMACLWVSNATATSTADNSILDTTMADASLLKEEGTPLIQQLSEEEEPARPSDAVVSTPVETELSPEQALAPQTEVMEDAEEAEEGEFAQSSDAVVSIPVGTEPSPEQALALQAEVKADAEEGEPARSFDAVVFIPVETELSPEQALALQAEVMAGAEEGGPAWPFDAVASTQMEAELSAEQVLALQAEIMAGAEEGGLAWPFDAVASTQMEAELSPEQ